MRGAMEMGGAMGMGELWGWGSHEMVRRLMVAQGWTLEGW